MHGVLIIKTITHKKSTEYLTEEHGVPIRRARSTHHGASIAHKKSMEYPSEEHGVPNRRAWSTHQKSMVYITEEHIVPIIRSCSDMFEFFSSYVKISRNVACDSGTTSMSP